MLFILYVRACLGRWSNGLFFALSSHSQKLKQPLWRSNTRTVRRKRPKPSSGSDLNANRKGLVCPDTHRIDPSVFYLVTCLWFIQSWKEERRGWVTLVFTKSQELVHSEKYFGAELQLNQSLLPDDSTLTCHERTRDSCRTSQHHECRSQF